METGFEHEFVGLTLEENEESFMFPATSEFSSAERNVISILGRTLNPAAQNMSDLILDMPRKWQIYEGVRGVALSRDRFQFIFESEYDLKRVLLKGPHTFNQWSLVLDRWTPIPPPDFLKFMSVWVRIRNIPVNHYTKDAITRLGDFAGLVKEVAFDPSKPQKEDFVRVRVKIDVEKPLRRFKTVTLLTGEESKVLYDFERVQKRCYACQRLTHDQVVCPWKNRTHQSPIESVRGQSSSSNSSSRQFFNKENPLFGVIKDSQVGIDRFTGRPKIAEEVLAAMRRYLMVASGPDRIIREERVKQSLLEVEKDPMAQKTILRLEPAPIFTYDPNKGKGIVFDFEAQEKTQALSSQGGNNQKFLFSAIKAANHQSSQPWSIIPFSGNTNQMQTDHVYAPLFRPTVQAAGCLKSIASGSTANKNYCRRRPSKMKRAQLKEQKGHSQLHDLSEENQLVVIKAKRKIEEVSASISKSSKQSKKGVVPKKGLPKGS